MESRERSIGLRRGASVYGMAVLLAACWAWQPASAQVGLGGGVSIGETLYHQQLPARLYTVPGVLDFDFYIGTSPDDLQQENIKVDSRSKVVTEEGAVSIE